MNTVDFTVDIIKYFVYIETLNSTVFLHLVISVYKYYCVQVRGYEVAQIKNLN